MDAYRYVPLSEGGAEWGRGRVGEGQSGGGAERERGRAREWQSEGRAERGRGRARGGVG